MSVRQKRFWSGRRETQHFTSAMDRTIPSVLLQIAFLLLVGAFSVHTRSLESPVNQVFQSKDDSDIQDQILAFLLRKTVMPLQEKDLLGLELARKITELQELQKELNLERKLVSNAMDNRRSMTRKRDDTCFWKYCV